MSAGFSVGDKVFWGSNGAVEAYVETMAAQAVERLGPHAPLTVFLQGERDGFFMGKIVLLGEWVADMGSRGQLLELLDAATGRLLQSGVFTEYGREWVASVVADLRVCVARNSIP